MNVHKHAHAELVEIDVTTDGQTIDVAVCDDGVGGAMDRVYGGIRGMRSRVEELGGELVISSPVGVGTTIKVSVPCVSW
jgi:signal transduction histidine kinase